MLCVRQLFYYQCRFLVYSDRKETNFHIKVTPVYTLLSKCYFIFRVNKLTSRQVSEC